MRCIFCAQHLQTGSAPRPVLRVLADLDAACAAALARGAPPRDLAFYGGTFTAMPLEHQLACLDLAARYRTRGLISAVRCSTRPDSVSEPLLSCLKTKHLDMVELGVQTFDSEALAASRRGYDGAAARDACRCVTAAGLRLGIQLMPGLPAGKDSMSTAQFLADVAAAVEMAPETLRLYPCLVMEGTELAELWRQGRYVPWTLDQTVRALAEALLLAWDKGIRVIRMGVAPEQGLEGSVLAGPIHPALGAMARALALCKIIARQHARVRAGSVYRLCAPRRLQGEFWGHGNALAREYAALGISRETLHWWDKPFFLMEYDADRSAAPGLCTRLP